MAALGDDCYFFCTSTCVKGTACSFRHVEAAKSCRIICQHWQMGGCMRPMCKFRHSDFAIQLDTSEVPCFWEALPTGCVKKNCMYKHSKPKAQVEGIATVTSSTSGDNSTVLATSKNEIATSQSFVQPVVTPVIIQPSVESEESNSSPMKKAPEVTQESNVLPKIELTEQNMNVNNNGDTTENLQEHTTKNKTNKNRYTTHKRKPKIEIKEEVDEKVARKIKEKAKKTVHQPLKSVKDRLGKVHQNTQDAISSSEKESDSESISDSDDSIENIKVMSMEEILRQKALESMMKKRVVEEKSQTSTVNTQSLSPIRDKKISVGEKRTLSTIQKKKTISSVQRKTYQTSNKERSATVWKVPVSKQKFTKHATHAILAKKSRHMTAQKETSSSSSEEESSDEDTTKKSSEESSTDSSSSASTSDSEEDTENDSEELDVRRVVVDVKTEKAARKKAKESFRKKQLQNTINTHGNRNKIQDISQSNRKVKHTPLVALNKKKDREKKQARRSIDIDYDSDDIVSSRVKQPLKLNIQGRLGKASSQKANLDSGMFSRTEKFMSVRSSMKPMVTKKDDASLKNSKGSSSEDSDSLAEVKVKTLEEIRMEKLRKLTAEENKLSTDTHRPVPVKDRLGSIVGGKQNNDGENLMGRQVVLVNDSGSKSDDANNIKPLDEQKKVRKRPWRSQRRVLDPLTAEADDSQRTAVVEMQSTDDDIKAEKQSSHKVHKEEHQTVESPFERLRRKALMKKFQSKFKNPESSDGAGDLETQKSQDVEKQDSASSTTSHQRNHRHHKRVKIERQIYMPPAMKNTVMPLESQTHDNLSPIRDLVSKEALSPQKRGPHPIAAAWAAGLTLSSKGMSGRRPETIQNSGTVNRLEIGVRKTSEKPKEIVSSRTEIGEKLEDQQIVSKSTEINSSMKASQPSAESSSGVTIKSFSEIMAEKRKRRLELQAQRSGANDLSASTVVLAASPSLPSSTAASLPGNFIKSNTTYSREVEAKPHVPIMPVALSSNNSSDTSREAINLTMPSTIGVLQKTSLDIPSFNSSLNVVTRVSPLMTSLTPHSAIITTDNVKLTTAKCKNIGEKKKKGKKLKTNNSLEHQINQSYSVTPENSNSNASASVSSHLTTSILSQAATSDSQKLWSSKLSSDAIAPQNRTSSSQPFQRNASTHRLSGSDTPSAPKFSTNIDTSIVRPQSSSTSKHIISGQKADSESTTRKTRLSMEDEFNFFEDEDLGIDEDLASEKPIDDLLQDIDDLLS